MHLSKLKILICIATSFLLYLFPMIARSGDLTANMMLSMCDDDTSTSFCNGYFEGYLDGLVHGTSVVSWNLPKDTTISAETVIKSFKKLLNDKPIIGDAPVGTAIALALTAQEIVKEKKYNK